MGIAIVAVFLAAGVTAGLYYWNSIRSTTSLSNAQITQKVWWRAALFARKATGRVPDLGWDELWQMTRLPGGFGLVAFATHGVSEDASLVNPYSTDDDVQTGMRIFAGKCAVCHGSGGSGWKAPSLNRPGYKHGDSDLAIYKVLRDGIPDTAMIAPNLSFAERWQVVGYLRTLSAGVVGHHPDDHPPLKIGVTKQDLLAAGSRSDEWLTYSGSLDGGRFSPLKEVTPANVSRLKIQWVRQFDTSDPTIEATPLVVDGVIFMTVPPASIVAIDANSGELIWKYDRPVADDLALCCTRVNRGLAILGNRLFFASVDGYLVAVNADTGEMLWETQVADAADGYSMTEAPLVANQSVVVGVAGGEFGIRGFLAAYDPATGKQRWRFNTIPGPGEAGHETWPPGDSWKTGGGATWITGSYDPKLDLLYWGVGNPGPDYNGDVRVGDNLYSNSVVALHAKTGKLAWYFQFTPHGEHDWDSAQTPILTNISVKGVNRKVICWANRNGFYYVLDRATGEFLAGAPFVEQNWARGLDSKGHPILADGEGVPSSGRLTKPGFTGGTNWQNPAFDRGQGLVFVPATESVSVFTKSSEIPSRDLPQEQYVASGATAPELPILVIRALDVATGAKKWESYAPPLRDHYYSGLLATAGGLVLGAQGGYVFALDSATGQEVWRVFLGGDSRAAPVTFTVDGHQVIAVSVGRSLLLFGLQSPEIDSVPAAPELTNDSHPAERRPVPIAMRNRF
jgi:alcohol dehydrogenase (cytochrome c)